MRFFSWMLLGLSFACVHNAQKEDEFPSFISQKTGMRYGMAFIHEFEANYTLSPDLTEPILKFLSDAKRSKAKYLSHLTLTTFQGARSCVILVGAEEDLKNYRGKDQPVDAPRRVNTELLGDYSKEKLFETKPFCKVAGKAAAKDFVLIQARIYVPKEGENLNNAID